MMNALRDSGDDVQRQDNLFEKIASDLHDRGYSIQPRALPPGLASDLCLHVRDMPSSEFRRAGVGRGDERIVNDFVRTDEVSWITASSSVEQEWLGWASSLQTYLNRRLFLGLYSFESHYAHYCQGDFYKRHVDAFKGQTNRILSLVTYLNPHWLPSYGGELVLYRDEQDVEGLRITPQLGTLVVFLSEEFPHEVMPSAHDRYSIAGWFRVNTSTAAVADPPI
jgi:SM-20-related protein